MPSPGEAIDVDLAIGVEGAGNYRFDQVAILGHRIAGDRIDHILCTGRGNAAIFQRIVVVAHALQIGLHETPAGFRTLGHELRAGTDHCRLLVWIEATHGRKPGGDWRFLPLMSPLRALTFTVGQRHCGVARSETHELALPEPY